MAVTFKDVNVPLILSRLRPGSAYQWIGGQSKNQQDSGYATLSEAVGEWRDPNTVPPSDAAMVAEMDVYLTEQGAAASALAVVNADLDTATTVNIQTVGAAIDTDLGLLATGTSAVNTALTANATDQTDLAAATTLAQVKPLVAHLLTREQAHLNRELTLYTELGHILNWLKLLGKPLGRLVDKVRGV